MRHLQIAAAQKKNFFVAVGFHRPHLPWACPQQFYDLYPNATDMAPPKHPDVPNGMPPVSWHNGLDGNSFEKPVPMELAQEMRRAYYACVSYTDSLVGQVLAELERLQLANNTVVVVRKEIEELGITIWIVRQESYSRRRPTLYHHCPTLLSPQFTSDHGWQLGEHNRVYMQPSSACIYAPRHPILNPSHCLANCPFHSPQSGKR